MGGLSSCCSPDQVKEKIDITRRPEDKPLLDADSLKAPKGGARRSGSFSRFNMPNITIKPEPLIADHIFPSSAYLSKRQKLEHFVEDTFDIPQITYDQNEWLVFSKNPKILDECRPLFDIIIWRLPVIEAFGKVTTDCETYLQQKVKIDKNANLTFPYDDIIRGVWDVLSKEQFTSRFGTELFDKLDFINNDKHDYLKNHTSRRGAPSRMSMSSVSTPAYHGVAAMSRLNSTTAAIPGYIDAELPPLQDPSTYEELEIERTFSNELEIDHLRPSSKFAELVSKLNKIKSAQKAQIVLIGQRRIIRYLIRKIRELEVEHPAMRHLTRRTNTEAIDFLNLGEGALARARAASTLIMHTVQVENIPPTATEEEVIKFFQGFGKVLDVTVTGEQKKQRRKKKHTKSEMLLDRTLGDNDETGITSENEENEENDENDRISAINAIASGTVMIHDVTEKEDSIVANVAFETQLALERFVKAAHSDEGLEWRGYILVVVADSAKTVEKRRKKRRVTAEAKVF